MLTIPNCVRFFMDKRIAFVEFDKVKILTEDLNVDFECVVDSAELVRINEKDLIVLDGEGRGFRIDFDKKEISDQLTESNILFQRSFYQEYIPVYKFKSIYDPFENGIFNSETTEVLWINSTCRANQFVQQYYLGIFNNQIFRADHVTGETFWIFTLGTYPPFKDLFGNTKEMEIKKLVGVFRNDLWIKLSDESFLVIDINSGQEVFHLRDLGQSLEFDTLYTGDYQMDQQTGKLKILAFRYYLVIDLETRTVETLKKFEDNWNFQFCQFDAGTSKFYFTGNQNVPKKSIGNLSVGIFDTDSFAVKWQYTLPDKDRYFSFVGQPQANDKYLCLKDSNDLLYFFDKHSAI